MRPDFAAKLEAGAGKDTESRHETHPSVAAFPFLLASLRHYFTPETPAPTGSSVDWAKLWELAERHAVQGLLSEAVREGPDIPPEIRKQLRSRANEIARFDLTLSAELARVVRLFEDHGIKAVSLKGPALGATLYGKAALRSSTDLDLLVAVGDVVRAKRLLETHGYYTQSILPSPTDKACLRRRDRQITLSRELTNPTDLLFVDLHWQLLPGYFPSSFDEQEIWGDLRTVSLAGCLVPTLSPEHLLLFLCAHGTKHGWDRLSWICDIARIVQVETGIDWSKVFNEARKTDTSRMVALGLLLASRLLKIQLPPVAITFSALDPTAQNLTEEIIKRLHDETMTPASVRETVSFTRRALERPAHRLRFVVGIFLEPTEAEYAALKLPMALHWLYYLFRPLRLAAKYAGSNSSSRP